MQITIAEAVPLRSYIQRRIIELESERYQNATADVEKGEKVEMPSRSFDQITSDLEKARGDFRKLDLLIAEANLKNVIEWDGREIPIMEAIQLAKEVRSEIDQFKKFASYKKKKRNSHSMFSSEEKDTYTITLYDPDEMRLKAQKREREVNRLSSLIEASNHTHTIEFDASDYLA